jgi:hypothetical protein
MESARDRSHSGADEWLEAVRKRHPFSNRLAPHSESLPQRTQWRFRPGHGGGLDPCPRTFIFGEDFGEIRFLRTKSFAEISFDPWRLGGSSYGVGRCRMNCPLGFDLVSLMRKGRGIQPPRRQERQGERGRHGGT